MDFTGLLIVSTVAFSAPLAVNLVRRNHVPSVVVEILAGIVIGPSVLGWVHIDTPIQVISTLGLSMLLFLAGMEIDLAQLRGRLILLVGIGMVFSLSLAIVIALDNPGHRRSAGCGGPPVGGPVPTDCAGDPAHLPSTTLDGRITSATSVASVIL